MTDEPKFKDARDSANQARPSDIFWDEEFGDAELDKNNQTHKNIGRINKMGRVIWSRLRLVGESDGWVTAIATVVLAIFTVYLAIYAERQEGIINRQISDGEESQRAFVNVSDLEIKLLTSSAISADAAKERSWVFSPIASNAGNTPVRNLHALSIVYIPGMKSGFKFKTVAHTLSSIYDGSGVATEEQGFSAPEDPSKSFGAEGGMTAFPLGPKSNEPLTQVSFPEADMMKELHNGWHYVLLGEIRYDDIFGKHHVTKYCFDIRTSMTANPDEFLPSKAYCPVWNCIDDECQ